jgi:selenide,water dikinase
MLLAASTDMDKKSRDIVTKAMIRGFDDQVKAGNSVCSGGQSVQNPWPIIGGVAKSICKMEDIIMPRHAVVGDVLVLTKALGTQVAVNVRQWMTQKGPKWDSIKHVITEQEALRAYCLAEASMARLNRTGAMLMRKHKAHGATDVTGFGLIGHADNLASNMTGKVSFKIHTLPILRKMREVNAISSFKLMEGKSAETSGGLLLTISKENAQAFIDEIQKLDKEAAWIVGDVIEGNNKAFIVENPTIIEV